MTDEPFSRRKALKLITGGLVSSGILSNTVSASDDSEKSNQKSITDPGDVETATKSYHHDHYSEFFDATTVANSGSIKYEQEKGINDDSPYTWQGGTWVNAADDSTFNTRSKIYWSGTSDSKVTIKELGSNPSNLQLGRVKVYRDDDSSNSFPNKYIKYTFNEVWDYLGSKTPFYLPSPPPGLLPDDKSEKTVRTNKAIVTFDNPTFRQNEDTVTNSMHWRWEVWGGANAGWHHVAAEKEVRNGYNYRSGFNDGFEEEDEHRYTLGSGFCFYTEDSTTCDIDLPPGIRSTGKCCEYITIDNPVEITDQHIDSARRHADNVHRKFDINEENEFGQKALNSYNSAKTIDDSFKQMVAYRSAAAYARGEAAYERASNGELDTDDLVQEAEQTRQRIEILRDYLSYTGRSKEDALATSSEIEKSLVSAQSWLDQVSRSLGYEFLNKKEKAMYSESSLEFAKGNLEDAIFYSKQTPDRRGRNKVNDGSEIQDMTADMVNSYQDTRADLESKIKTNINQSNSSQEYILVNAENYFDRAEERFRQGYTAAALMDLIYADSYRKAADKLTNKFNVDEKAVTVEQELTADKLNRATNQTNSRIELSLFKIANLELKGGNQSLDDFKNYGDKDLLQRAYIHYRVTREMVDLPSNVLERFRESEG